MCSNRGDCCEDIAFLNCEGKTSLLSLPHQELPCKILYSHSPVSVINLQLVSHMQSMGMSFTTKNVDGEDQCQFVQKVAKYTNHSKSKLTVLKVVLG